MSWHHSIIAKISLIFALALLGIGAVFISLASHERENNIKSMQDYSHVAIRSAFDNGKKKLDFEKLEEMGFNLIEDKEQKEKILLLPKPPKPFPMRHMEERFKFGFYTVYDGASIYAILQNRESETLVLQTPYKKELFPRILFPILTFSFMIFLYIGTIKSILPLKTLRKKIKLFADGNYDIECTSGKKDEIAALANEFDSAVKKIKSLRDSRQLFLRNIMHELKTPITKGKLASEMIEDATYTSILQNVFKRQEVLLEEFSRIEKLSADELKLDMQNYNIEDLVDFALDILEDKKEHITVHLTPISLHVDFELFGVVLKNLLDNGINYASDAHVSITNDTKTITVSNKGNPLEFPLERYGEPYFLEGKKQKSFRGLGFGLFITWHVIRLHGMKIDYQRKGDMNHFVIKL
ncbi:MAG: HAMP domain-containing histidine kinase [Campylobacteraceae bacterium]|nr:HAMP domain-containing histidine kinase [Campylobacteraceae bacterium]